MFVVFDLETTGLSSMQNDIIQFSYIMFDSNNMFVRADNLYFYYEGMSWNQEVADISHGISLDFLKTQADKFKENVIKMYTVLNHANVCGHNSNYFDCPFVKNWLKRMGLSDFEFGIQQDTMLAFRPYTKRARIKLTKLAAMFGLSDAEIDYATKLWFGITESTQSHDARFDTAMTALLTIGGINKKLITFDRVVAPSINEDIDDSELDMDDSVTATAQSFDPLGYYIQCNGHPIAVNHNKHKYAKMATPNEVTDISMNKDLLCPGDFKELEEGTYQAEFNGITMTVTQYENEDIVSIKTPYGVIPDTTFSNVKDLFASLS